VADLTFSQEGHHVRVILALATDEPMP